MKAGWLFVSLSLFACCSAVGFDYSLLATYATPNCTGDPVFILAPNSVDCQTNEFIFPFQPVCNPDGSTTILFYQQHNVTGPDGFRDFTGFPRVCDPNTLMFNVTMQPQECILVPGTENAPRQLYWLFDGCGLPFPPMPLDETPPLFPPIESQFPTISSQVWFLEQGECAGEPTVIIYHRTQNCIVEFDFQNVRWECTNNNQEAFVTRFTDAQCNTPDGTLSFGQVCPIFLNPERYLRITSCAGGENQSSDQAVAITVSVLVVFFCLITVCIVSILAVFYLKHKQLDTFQLSPEVQLPVINDIVVGELIGSGEYGNIYRGTWNSTSVALKSLKGSNPEEFANELKILNDMRHPNILSFFGIFFHIHNEPFMVTEFMDKGDLLGILQTHGELITEDLIEIIRQIATGMSHLHQQSVIHRDLACRNILCSGDFSSLSVKVADFGLSRQQIESFYQSQTKKLPVRWCAPEGMQYLKFTLASDVWSFGVVVWEIFSRGTIPYAGVSNEEIVQKVPSGMRLEPPKDMPSAFVHLLDRCWKLHPEKRPTFQEIVQILSDKVELKRPKSSWRPQTQNSGDSSEPTRYLHLETPSLMSQPTTEMDRLQNENQNLRNRVAELEKIIELMNKDK